MFDIHLEYESVVSKAIHNYQITLLVYQNQHQNLQLAGNVSISFAKSQKKKNLHLKNISAFDWWASNPTIPFNITYNFYSSFVSFQGVGKQSNTLLIFTMNQELLTVPIFCNRLSFRKIGYCTSNENKYVYMFQIYKI